ncbi:MAG: flavin oxidoreductase/NADH oxidase, partial [Lachnospira sp.]|nr:flavin oxidoreductase/NADH oxidase [Lachnospira sp.]
MSEKFSWRSPEEIQRRGREVGVNLPMSSDTSICGMPLSVGELTLNNRLGIAPMEGADSLADGSPSELTLRRYVREAQGGAAVIWFEAISVVPEGRSSRTQLLLTRENLDSFKRMTDAVKKAGIQANGFAPYLICQANHSGRYSNPDNKPAPLIAFRSPYLEQFRNADDSCIVSDDYLKSLEERFGEGARLAKEAGFDAVDIKSCHGYLFAEVAAGFTRPGRYGGSYENRTRLLKNSIRAAKAYESPSFQIVSRIG